MYKFFLKRFFDLTLSIFIFLLIMPIFILIFLLLINENEVFFKQKRPGQGEKIFTLYKFKTMTDKKDAEGNFLPDEYRLTKLGKFIRSTSLDEIPQLLNVIKGDMSLVGPRPLLIKYLPLYNEFQKKRHLVKPGITGWAQVNGRNSISWQEKFECDIWYVDNQSFFLDIKILFLTFIKVIKRSDINSKNNTTMETFKGNN